MSTTEITGIQRDDTVHGETYFTAADMATAAAQGFRDGQAAGDAGTVASCDYKSMFGAAVSTIATISEALGIDEEEAACANGAELILEAIQRKNDAILAAMQKRPPVPLEGMAGWISVDEMLPEWAARDDTPCFINHKEVPPTLTSETVLVALKGGGVRTDKLTTIEGKSAGWWHSYGERVIAWQKTPAPPLASEAKGAT